MRAVRAPSSWSQNTCSASTVWMGYRAKPPGRAMSESLDRTVNRLTEGPIGRALWNLSLPIVLSNTLYTSHQLVNTFWVGRLGAAAVAAVSVSFPVLFLLVSLGGGLSVAGSILIAQYSGARDQAMVNHVAAQTLVMVVAISAVLSILGYAAVKQILHAMGIGPEVFDQAASYMRVSFLGIVFMFSFVMFQSILRGTGEVKLPLYIVMFSVTLNLLLDPLLIFGWGPVPAFGVVGAAWATLITQAMSTAVGFKILTGSRYGVRLQFSKFAPDWKLIKRVFLLGFPASIEQSMQALGITLMTVIVAGFGTLAIAAYGIGFRVLTFVIIPALGISMATATLVGQNIGAGNIQRAIRVATLSSWAAFCILTVAGVAFYAAAPQVVRFFVPGDEALVVSGALVVRFMSISFGFIGLQQSLMGAFRGAGDTFMPMTLAIINVWVLQLPVAYLLGRHTSLGVVGLWYTFPISAIVTAALAVLRFRTHSWRRLIRTEESALREKVTQEILIEEEGLP
jgi:putative MATE family efflux protein